MKPQTMLALIILIQGSLICIEGGGETLTAPQDPFNNLCHIVLTMHNPVEGGFEYSNQVEINYTVSGADLCRYRTSGGWNTIPCNGSITRTLEYGEQTLTIQGWNSFCMVQDSATFTVVDFAPSLVGSIDYFLLLPILTLLWLIFDEEQRHQRERRPPQRKSRTLISSNP